MSRFTYVKLCEFESPDAAFEAAGCGADALGFHILQRPGAVAKARKFARWMRFLPPTATTVLLADLPLEDLLSVLRIAPFEVVQLYPDFTPAEIAKLRREARRPLTIWKVVSARAEEHAAKSHRQLIATYDDVVDGYLLDSSFRGGTGKTGDWAVCAEFVRATPRPVLLAGGLTTDNVAAAIRTVKPFGVDVESGVSLRVPELGLVKSMEKCRAFVAAVRTADATGGAA